MTARILVPYDRSEQARDALSHAIESFESAEVVLLHVIEPFADHTGAGGYDGMHYRQQVDDAETMLAGVRDEYDGEDRERISTVVRYGRPVHEIIRHVEDEQADHVVMGSHGRDGATRILLGSVAETVARRSPVPVTVVRKQSEGVEPANHVLVPFDASEYAKRALKHAVDSFPDAEITALYIAHPTDNGVPETSSMFDILENWDQEVKEHIDSILGVAEGVGSESDHEIETETTDGRPAKAIVTYAEENDIDHVVIGSTGRDGLARVLLGSVAEIVLRRAPVSVTIVR